MYFANASCLLFWNLYQ